MKTCTLHCDTVCFTHTHTHKKLPKVTENQVSPSVICRNKEVYLRFREYTNLAVKHGYYIMGIPEIIAPGRGGGLTETVISEKK